MSRHIQPYVFQSGQWVAPGRPALGSDWNLAGYNLVWHDEFDGTSVDTSKWNVRDGWVGGNESSICWARNVSVSNSCLVIQPKRETSTSGSTTRQYTSGYLDTTGGFNGGTTTFYANRPCLFIARIKCPLAPGISGGMWPAFWLRDISLSGEIDILEAWQLSASHTGSSASYPPEGHYQASSWADTNSTSVGSHGWAVSGQDLTQWHTYAVKIDPDGSDYFQFDGNATTRADSASTYPWLGTNFSQYGIRLNLQVGQPAYYGDPDSNTDFTQQMLVDWVRVYQPIA